MLTVRTPFKKAEKLKRYLLDKGLFNKKYKITKDKKFIYFPINEKKALKKKFPFAEFADKKLKKIEKVTGIDLLKDKLTRKELSLFPSSFDIVGDIIILELKKNLIKKEKLIAETLLKLHKNIKTVVKKAGIHKGIYRTQKLKVLAGVNKKETIYKENNARIKLDVEKVYFSPRLSNERKRIIKLVKPDESILVMFSGCGPYPLVLSKNTKAKEIYGVEINLTAHKYALDNIKLNKAKNIKLFLGDVNKIIPKINKKFDRVLMPLPKSAGDFLELALKSLKPKGIIHFYDFLKENEFENAKEKIRKAYKKAGKKAKILRIVKCGQHAPRVFRICVDFKVI